MRRLVCACVVRKPPKTCFLASRTILHWSRQVKILNIKSRLFAYPSVLTYSYIPDIYVEGYIVFVFPFVCLSIRSLVPSYFCYVKVLVKVSRVVYISVTTDQKAFIFGSLLPWRVGISQHEFRPQSPCSWVGLEVKI